MPQSKHQVKESWITGFTDPNQHNDAHFIYLVTVLRDEESRQNAVNSKKEFGTYDPSQDINLITYPERIHEMNLIFASVVSNKRPIIVASPACGAILRCPVENILQVELTDQFLSLTREKNPIKTKSLKYSVDDLLADTSDNVNEVVIKGETEFGKVKAIAFFDMPGAKSPLENKGNSMGLPIIRYHWQTGGNLLSNIIRNMEQFQQVFSSPLIPTKPPVNSTPYKPNAPQLRRGFLLTTSSTKNLKAEELTHCPNTTKSSVPKTKEPSTTYCGFTKGFYK